MGFVDSLRAKLPGAKPDDGTPKKKSAKETGGEEVCVREKQTCLRFHRTRKVCARSSLPIVVLWRWKVTTTTTGKPEQRKTREEEKEEKEEKKKTRENKRDDTMRRRGIRPPRPFQSFREETDGTAA